MTSISELRKAELEVKVLGVCRQALHQALGRENYLWDDEDHTTEEGGYALGVFSDVYTRISDDLCCAIAKVDKLKKENSN